VNHPTAALLIIGNEILSGRTQDQNLNYIAKGLNDAGIRFMEARVIPDIETVIVEALNHCRQTYDYIFTTGGIGPTHDDITASCIATAFDRPFGMHPEAERILRDYYQDNISEARLRMANMPEGAELLPNSVSAAPGFKVDNVYVMAGVPSIMRAMFDYILPMLKGGQKIYSEALSAYLPESTLAVPLGQIQEAHPEVEIGSYPQWHDGKIGVSIVVRGIDLSAVVNVREQVRSLMQAHVDEIRDGELRFE